MSTTTTTTTTNQRVYHNLPFKSATDFVEFFDPALREGKRSLHPWQRETLDFLSCKQDLIAGRRPRFTTAHRLRFLLLANNGSGKDAYVIAAFVSFVLCCWIRYKQVITSSSYMQLDTQTRTYIKILCQEVNQYMRANGVMDEDAIDIKKETFKSRVFTKEDGTEYSLTAGEVITFVTDEGGRAEGHHPWPDALEGEGVILITNEAKSISEEIFRHFSKCTFNFWIEVSSAGETSGHFYKNCSEAIWWDGDKTDKGFAAGKYLMRKVTYLDCPHIAPSEVQAMKDEHGENSPFFRNTYLSEFVTTGDSVVITSATLEKCLREATHKIDVGLPRRAGLDLAAGGDECTFYVFDNNVCVGSEPWRAKDTELTVDALIGADDTCSGIFQKFGFTKTNCHNIFADDNGLGQPILDGLARRGWSVCRVRAQHKAANPALYLNRGIELWVRFARLVEECIVILPKADEKLQKELTNRHYDTSEVQGKRKLLSKEEEKAQGNPSPNRADAVVLAFCGLTINDFRGDSSKKVTKVAQGVPSQSSIANTMTVRVGGKTYTVDNTIQQLFKPSAVVTPANKRTINSNPINLQKSLYDSN